jgi:hypothetical protein
MRGGAYEENVPSEERQQQQQAQQQYAGTTSVLPKTIIALFR